MYAHVPVENKTIPTHPGSLKADSEHSFFGEGIEELFLPVQPQVPVFAQQ